MHNSKPHWIALQLKIEFATLVQQRAYLQAYNQTAFKLLIKMVQELTAANQDATNISAMIHDLSDRLSRGLQRLDYLVLLNASLSGSPHHIKQKQCLLHINRVLWQFGEESKLLLQNPISLYTDLKNPLIKQTSLEWKRKQMELYLIDSFYSAKPVMPARMMLLRKVLKAVS